MACASVAGVERPSALERRSARSLALPVFPPLCPRSPRTSYPPETWFGVCSSGTLFLGDPGWVPITIACDLSAGQSTPWGETHLALGTANQRMPPPRSLHCGAPCITTGESIVSNPVPGCVLASSIHGLMVAGRSLASSSGGVHTHQKLYAMSINQPLAHFIQRRCPSCPSCALCQLVVVLWFVYPDHKNFNSP